MADKNAPKMGKSTSSIGAFASTVSAQQKFIVVNLDALAHDNTEPRPLGAARFLPRLMAHEVLHTLGFSHPKNPARYGEATDSRSFEQLRDDIAAGITRETALGTLDKKTGKHVITYSLAGNPGRVPIDGGVIVNGCVILETRRTKKKTRKMHKYKPQ